MVLKAKAFDGGGAQTAKSGLEFVQNIPDACTEYAMVEADLQWKIQLWNEGARLLYGYEPDEMIGRQCALLLDGPGPEQSAQLEEIFHAALRRGKWEGLVSSVGKDSKRLAVRTVATPRRGESGEAEGFLLVSRQVSDDPIERKQADRKFRGLLESAPDAMVIVDKSRKIVLVNSQTQKLFGYSREELLGQPVEMLTPERFRTRHPGHRAGYFPAPRLRPMGAGFDLYAMRKDGVEFPVEISLGRLESTGLGLHLSQKLAGLLGGRITFDSVYGKGSVFPLTLREREAA